MPFVYVVYGCSCIRLLTILLLLYVFIQCSAKVFVYLESELVANILFGTFALVWFAVRWYYYTTNILVGVYTYGWLHILQPAIDNGAHLGVSASTWYKLYIVFFGFLVLLLVLHVYWGVLIVKMVIKALSDGNVEKDIRSDSEDESAKSIGDHDESDAPLDGATAAAAASADSAKPKRRRAPKVE